MATVIDAIAINRELADNIARIKTLESNDKDLYKKFDVIQKNLNNINSNQKLMDQKLDGVLKSQDNILKILYDKNKSIDNVRSNIKVTNASRNVADTIRNWTLKAIFGAIILGLIGLGFKYV